MNNKVRIVGFASALSYIIVILYTWMSAELGGYVYFLAGEPNRAILYTEWMFGLVSIIIIAYEFRKSLIESKTKVMYDPLV